MFYSIIQLYFLQWQFVLALLVDIIVDVDPSEHVIVVDEEGQIESEIDQGPEHLNQSFHSIN